MILIVIALAVIVMRLITMRQLMKTRTRWATVWRWSGLTLVALLVLLAAARPGVDPVEKQAAAAKQSGVNTNVFLIVDRSVDSGVEDFGDGQPRMSGIRTDIAAVIGRYPQARFAVIAFASRPSLDWPLSDDAWSLEPVVARLSPYDGSPDDSSQVNSAAAANVLRYQLIAAGQQYPESQSLVYYFGSGAGGTARRRVSSTRCQARWTAERCSATERRSTNRVCNASRNNSASPTSIETPVSRWPKRRRVPIPPLSRPRTQSLLRMSSPARSCTGCSPRWQRCCCCSRSI